MNIKEGNQRKGAKESYFTLNISVHVLQNCYKRQHDMELLEKGLHVPRKVPRQKPEFLQSCILVRETIGTCLWNFLLSFLATLGTFLWNFLLFGHFRNITVKFSFVLFCHFGNIFVEFSSFWPFWYFILIIKNAQRKLASIWGKNKRELKNYANSLKKTPTKQQERIY